jgi:sugar phosphate isomerase/epimerase
LTESPKISIAQVTTYTASVEDDIAAYAAAGADGIGVWEYKLKDGQDEEVIAKIRDAGLAATLCTGTVPSVLPDPYFNEPREPEQRIEAMVAGVKRLAKFDPVAILCVTGDPKGQDVEWFRRTTVEGLRVVADEASKLGLTIGLEPYRQGGGTLVTTLPDTAALVDEIGADNIKIIADVWHFWDLPAIDQDLYTYVDRLIGVQLNDYKEPSGGWCDRLLPGDGTLDLAKFLGILEDAGYDGWYDVEVFSDNGIFGNAFPHSVWDLDPRTAAEHSVQNVRQIWADRKRPVH